MTTLSIYEDAPRPTPDQVEASLHADKKRRVSLFFEIMLSLFAIIVVPIFLGVAAWVFLQGEHVGLSGPLALFFGTWVWMFSFLGALLLASETKGKIVTPEDLYMFHCADKPLSPHQWYEVESILSTHPGSTEKVAFWVDLHEGTLLQRHLWALRREHVASHFILDVVETCGAQDVNGYDVHTMVYEDDIVLPHGPGDILSGRLVAHPLAADT